MTIWCNSREEFVRVSSGLLTQIEAIVEPALLARREIDGYCRGCGQSTRFDIGPPLTDPADWKNLREGLVCGCGFTSRMRLTIKLLDELLEKRPFARAAVLERVTPLFAHLQARLPSLIGCECIGPPAAPGATVRVNDVDARNENMMSLSFGDGSLDLLMHFDILEHVPDADAGLREAHRVLATGGAMYFTCPFYENLETNIVRARIGADGEVEHLLPEIFHGNPISGEGSLVFIHPSLQLFEMLQNAGFSRMQAASATTSPKESSPTAVITPTVTCGRSRSSPGNRSLLAPRRRSRSRRSRRPTTCRSIPAGASSSSRRADAAGRHAVVVAARPVITSAAISYERSRA